MTDRSSLAGKKGVCVYIDGFNLYHAVADLKDHRLKWLNMRSLAVSFLKPNENPTPHILAHSRTVIPIT
jgi:hypothetical protein